MQEMQETQNQSLGGEDPLEKEMATHSSILAWRIPWAEEPGGLQSMGLQRVRHDWATKHIAEKPTLTRMRHPESTVYIRVHSRCHPFNGLGQMCKDMCPSLSYRVLSLPETSSVLIYSSLFSSNLLQPILPFPECLAVEIVWYEACSCL